MTISRSEHGFSTRAIAPGERMAAPTPHAVPRAVEKAMAELEEGGQGFAFSSGQAAIACVLELANSDAHVILSDGLHGGRYRLFEDIRRRTSGLRISYVNPRDKAALAAAFLPDETKMVWVESPGWPRAELADLDMIAGFARDHDLISVCDNTNATPFAQRPLAHGFTLSLHAAPGYLYGGVLDEGGMAVVAEDQEFTTDRLGFLRASLGGMPDDRTLELAHRALGSLEVRMARVCDTTTRVASFLAGRADVVAVHHASLAAKGEDLGDRLPSARSGGFLAFVVDGDISRAAKVLARLRLIGIDHGPGGPGSLIDHPADTQFSMVPAEIRAGLGIDDGLFGLWIGLENPDDLIADLESALG